MNEILTIEEIYARFSDEWVLLENPETKETLEIIRGKLLFHHKDRHEVHRKAMELRPKHSAVFYTGRIPSDMAILI